MKQEWLPMLEQSPYPDNAASELFRQRLRTMQFGKASGDGLAPDFGSFFMASVTLNGPPLTVQRKRRVN